MTILQSIILGIVEGVTEFLPVSSTGHLIIVAKLLGVADGEFTKSFTISIQLGAIVAVVVLYGKRLVVGSVAYKKVLVAFLPAAVIGFLLYKIIKQYLLANSLAVVWALFLGGVLLIVFEYWYARKNQSRGLNHGTETVSYKKALVIGLVQAISAIPGVSRSGATMVGGLLMGMSRPAIVEFSFLLAIPTMAAATGYDLYKTAGSFSFDQFYVLAIGFIVSFLVAVAAIKWLLHFIKNHSFILFGVYRVVVALVFWFLIAR